MNDPIPFSMLLAVTAGLLTFLVCRIVQWKREDTSGSRDDKGHPSETEDDQTNP